MTRTRCSRRAAGVLAGAATIVAATVAPSTAIEGDTLTVAGPATGTVGLPVVLTANGVLADHYLDRWLEVFALPTAVVSSCPPSVMNAPTVASGSSSIGGDLVATAVHAGNAEPYSIPIVWSPRVAGTYLVCTYLNHQIYTDVLHQHTITISNGGGTVTTPPPPVVTPPSTGSAPARLTAPRLAKQGARLVCSRGTWSGSPTSYAYKWKVGSKVKAGATSSKLRITRALRGKTVSCGVVARNAAGSTTAWSRRLRVR
ncbi:hypothetical protein [Nocardioides astragali]|uniref:Ig-like domain-containing protein n=1 Tax=Nocardioides astragali TaxID=1776736 RepID=A0ABW2N826_9ACTN|nr:hypothetical protein [Nocardioides astragali]